MVETDTFGANKLVLAEFDQELVGWTLRDQQAGGGDRAGGVRRSSRRTDKPRFVVGSMGPGTKLITLGHTTWEAMLDSYAEQARGLIDGGVDAFIIETCQDLLQVKCAINACLDALDERGKTHDDVPIMVSVTIETTGTMLLGTEIAAVVNALAHVSRSCSLGLNCATGPTEMGEHVAYLAQALGTRPISVMPNAGLPVLVEGKTSFPLGAEPFADALVRFVDEFGVGIVGGCCGTTPEHIRQLARALDGERRRPQAARSRAAEAAAARASTAHVEFGQDNSFLIVAERTNTNGSRKFKRLLEEENWDGLVSMAREEVRDGSHLLDVCVDFVGRDGVRDMTEVVTRYVRQVDAPLMLDSTQAGRASKRA